MIIIWTRPRGSVVEHTLGKGEVTSSILVVGFFAKILKIEDFIIAIFSNGEILLKICSIIKDSAIAWIFSLSEFTRNFS